MRTALNAFRRDRMTVKRVVAETTDYGAERETYATVYQDVLCRLSFSSTDVIGEGDLPDAQYQATLFYDGLEIVLQRGDVVEVVCHGSEYVGTIGEIAAYESHMQAPVQLRKR